MASNTKSQLKSSSFNSTGLFGPISRDLAIKFKTPNHNLSLSFKKKDQNRNFYNDDTNEGASTSQSQKRQHSYGGNQYKKGKSNYMFFHVVNSTGYSRLRGSRQRPKQQKQRFIKKLLKGWQRPGKQLFQKREVTPLIILIPSNGDFSLPFPSSSTPSGDFFSFREGLLKPGSGFARHLVNGNKVEFSLRSSRSHLNIF